MQDGKGGTAGMPFGIGTLGIPSSYSKRGRFAPRASFAHLIDHIVQVAREPFVDFRDADHRLL